MAVALLIGQALLCALIGWLTLGRSPSAPGAGTVVGQAAAPPPRVVPAPDPPTPAATSRAPEAPASKTRRPAQRTTRPSPVPTRTVSPPPATSSAPAPAPPTTVPSVTPSSEPIALPPEPPAVTPTESEDPAPEGDEPDEKIQWNVTVGERCYPEGAYGKTRRGALVRCLRGWHDAPRWKIV